MKQISGGVTAPMGFTASGVHCGVKKGKGDGNQPARSGMPEVLADKKDLALIVSEQPCAAAAVYTMNRVKAAPIYVTMDHLENGEAQAIVANSGNANACAPNSHEHAEEMCVLAAQATGLKPEDFVVASTGVIGQELNIDAIGKGLPQAAAALSRDGSDAAANAIMTTDTVKKEVAVETTVGGKTVRMGGIAKGSGMIHPNMGTMLCFLTTDCAISPEMIKSALLDTVRVSFNRISVDGDTSTNDTCIVLANGMAGNAEITEKNEDYAAFLEALKVLCTKLARMMAKDGEGAKHLITCTVQGAASEKSAETIAKSVISSTLTKAAIFGCDANWGRVLCAMGYSGESFDPDKVDVHFASGAGDIAVCEQGRGLPFDEELAKKILSEDEVEINIQMGEGDGVCTCWGCDITYDYIKINGDYRT